MTKTKRVLPRKISAGVRFGRLSVLEMVGDWAGGSGLTRWRCKCDCGEIVDRSGTGLMNGKMPSCGCAITSKIDMRNEVFGRLTVIGRSPLPKTSEYWDCLCECGATTQAKRSSLLAGAIRSCGCLSRERKTTHGHAGGVASKTYYIWSSMLARCRTTTHAAYSDYGGRGINVCDEWMEYSRFLSDMGERPHGKSLDRIDNDLGYSAENCRWSTRKEQNNNRRNNVRLTLDGVEKTLAEWSSQMGIRRETVSKRLLRGWSVERALTAPVRVTIRKLLS